MFALYTRRADVDIFHVREQESVKHVQGKGEGVEG